MEEEAARANKHSSRHAIGHRMGYAIGSRVGYWHGEEEDIFWHKGRG